MSTDNAAGQPEKTEGHRAGLVGRGINGNGPLRLIDLEDGRRANKSWLPADDRDVTNGLVIEDEHGKPACVRHGAMNRVDAHRALYRCSEMYCGVGAELA